ncbi:uncharacterized protein LOC100845380 [Brachypodium distachyon]|nr:uncharacterized protein LOC100845380 [Brachypodium distachyon]XP_024315872.1 uncharacterized protein LOC100845380 [Brachypodium distachyon]XP_024315873.1 uncharacterized protein LOC100845380 [Brachypodium distachyon]KQK07601.1 hypothetical protein BRADI_2g36497v3 [Brachypodium distachyon]KQK07602.1 hypothetical protein BRADI_2g36497v3 [Brachypodium distachyon]|eukprot:XP_024315871.1 uncharacterized protein LOC100845380 [Brachypodium distachyon]
MATSSAISLMPSSAPSSPCSPPRTAPARRRSPADGGPSGDPRLSISTPATISAPNDIKRFSIVSKILSDHPGPARRFHFAVIRLQNEEEAKQIDNWFRSRALANLQELDFTFGPLEFIYGVYRYYRLPSSVLRFASTLVMARITCCDFPNEIAHFPLLKQLTLRRVSISDIVFRGMISACHVLETLHLEEIHDACCLRITSSTLRSIGTCCLRKGELIIEDAPRLERLLLSVAGDETIRVIRIRAPKLEILGALSPCISEIKIANLVFQGMIPANLKTPIRTVKVLALRVSIPDLSAVLDVLRCFPCLEKLYVTWNKYLKMKMKNLRQYDPLDPIECLETHLKKVVFRFYQGNEEDSGFAKFFILNTKVLKEMIFGVREKVNKKWVAAQHRLLKVKNRASQDAQFEFRYGPSECFDTHDLSIADPFTALI